MISCYNSELLTGRGKWTARGSLLTQNIFFRPGLNTGNLPLCRTYAHPSQRCKKAPGILHVAPATYFFQKGLSVCLQFPFCIF